MSTAKSTALEKMLGTKEEFEHAQAKRTIRKAESKKFGHNLAKRPEVFRKHVLAGMRLGILKHPTIKLKDRIKSLTKD